MSWSQARRLRQIVQVLSFSLFVGLMFAAIEKRVAPALADLFFRLDPLVALTAMLGGRTWIPNLGLALITLVVTLLFGRVWCGWICPLGSLLEWISLRKWVKRPPAIPIRLRVVKYFLLATLIVMSLFGSLALMTFDPLAILTRTMTTAVLPAFFYAINALESLLYRLGWLVPLLDEFESQLRGTLLPTIQPVFAQNLFIFSLFLVIVVLNLLAPRFWCRYLCPLGALLGWLAKISLFRPVIGSSCNHCALCARQCQPGAMLTEKGRDIEIMQAECTVCLDCLAACKQQDIHFRSVIKPDQPHPSDLSRREALGALGVGAAAAFLLATDLRAVRPSTFLVRPPGAQDEQEFLARCLRCAQCMKICPTAALQPAFLEAGLGSLWTPVLVPRLGYCDYGCTACGQVCPSGAIPLLTLAAKRQAAIGKASINRNRCLPWASNVPCIVCEEMCPTPQKSIRLEELNVVNGQGEQIFLQRPYVLREQCIGCGICEARCPLEGEAGIRVYRV